MDNKENFKQYIINSLKFNLQRFTELNSQSSKELIDSCFQQIGSYSYKRNYLNEYNLSQDPEIKQLCNQFEETILTFIKNHLKENKAIDEYTKQLFERDYRIAISFTRDYGVYYENDYYDLDYDLFATNGFHYYIKAFRTLNCYQELEWDKKEKEFWSNEKGLKGLILKYTRSYYEDTATPWFPDHLDWWPKEFWWNDLMAYGAVVYRGKKFQDVVLYPENLDKVEI